MGVNKKDSMLESVVMRQSDKLLKPLAKKLGVSKKQLANGLFLIFLAFLTFECGGKIIRLLFVFVYPAYCSILVLKNKCDDNVERKRRWLKYWVGLGTFSFIERPLDMFFAWIPFYSTLKGGVLLWCISPWNVNDSIYKKLVLSLYTKNHKWIDNLLDDTKKQLNGISDKVQATLGLWIAKNVEEEDGWEMIN